MILDSLPVETIKLLGSNREDFRNIGCFLACAFQQHGDVKIILYINITKKLTRFLIHLYFRCQDIL